MCDKCGGIFSERSEFSTFTGTTRKKDPETGKTKVIQEELDMCEYCTEAMGNGSQQPTIQPREIQPRYEGQLRGSMAPDPVRGNAEYGQGHPASETFTQRETHPEEWAGPGFPPGDFSPGR